MGHVNLMKKETKTIPAKKRIIFYSAMIIIIIAGYFLVFNTIYASAIYPGIYCCNDFSLGGLEQKHARILLEIFVEGVDVGGYTFYAQTDLGEKQATIQPNLIAPTDPDLSRSIVLFDLDTTIKNAHAIGRQGNILQRAMSMISSIGKIKKLDLIVFIEKQEIKKMLQQQFKVLEKPVDNTRIVFVDDDIELEQESAGYILDYEFAIDQLKQNLEQFKHDDILIPVILQEPEVSYDDALPVFDKVKKVFNDAPYTILYKDKTWEIKKDTIGEWFELYRDDKGFVTFGFDNKRAAAYLHSIGEQINIEPREHRIVIENNRVKDFQVGAPGLAINIDKSIQIIENSVISEKNKIIPLVVETVEPSALPEDIDSMGIKELIGIGVSNFAGSPENRRHNIKVGAEKLHGILIAPDEEFSLISALGEINQEEGFLPELVIKGDRTVPEYGGGLCQIGTTTFRAVLNSGLPVTERRNHSYRVAYYEPAGTDATIYDPHPDFRFINDTGHHILFQTKIEGNDLIFEFYGTYDNRIVETEDPEIYNIVDPGPPQYIETDELLPGEKEKVESPHFGADAKFKNLVVYANGIERVDIWRSHYKPWPEVWRVGREIEEKSRITNKESRDEE